MKVEDYKKEYNAESIICKRLSTIFSDTIKGEKNPWFNHNGKLSPYSKDFIGYENLSEEETEEIRQAVFKKSVEKRMEGDGINCDTRLIYYTSRGMCEEDARKALKERQTTFSLKKLIKKYGEEEGSRKWKERQEKWQNTLTSKSQEAIDDINKRKVHSGYSKISQKLFDSLEIPKSRYATNGRRISN